MLAVAVSVFATTYISSDNAGAIDRADYQVGANMRATFSTAAGPPQVAALTAALPSGVHALQAFRDVGRPGQSGLEATVLGVQGTDFWNIAYARPDFASQSLRSLTAKMSTADPDGATVPGSPRALALSVYSSGVSARIAVQISDATGDVRSVKLGTTSAQAGWNDLRASLTDVAFPIRVRAITVSPTDIGVAGDVAFRNLRTDSGAIVESFDITDGWWQEDFAPNPAALPVKPTFVRTDGGPALRGRARRQRGGAAHAARVVAAVARVARQSIDGRPRFDDRSTVSYPHRDCEHRAGRRRLIRRLSDVLPGNRGLSGRADVLAARAHGQARRRQPVGQRALDERSER